MRPEEKWMRQEGEGGCVVKWIDSGWGKTRDKIALSHGVAAGVEIKE